MELSSFTTYVNPQNKINIKLAKRITPVVIPGLLIKVNPIVTLNNLMKQGWMKKDFILIKVLVICSNIERILSDIRKKLFLNHFLYLIMIYFIITSFLEYGYESEWFNSFIVARFRNINSST